MLSISITDKLLWSSGSSGLKMQLWLSFLKLLFFVLTGLPFWFGEIVLCVLSSGGPLLILVLVLTMNTYLMLVPMLRWLVTGMEYSEAFAKARRTVCHVFRIHAQFYHRHTILNFENIPDKGGAILVYYHAAIPLDYMFILAKTVLEKKRLILSIVDRFMIWIPGFEMLSAGFGCFAGTRKDCIKKLKSGRLIGIAPGGGYEAQCARSDTYEMLWKKRSGFAKVAFEADVPIIPIFTENIREAMVNMQTGVVWWKKLYEWTRIPITPLYGGFPVQLTTHIGEPIHPKDCANVEELRSRVVAAMESMIRNHQKLPGDVIRAVGERIESEQAYLERKKLEYQEQQTQIAEEDSEGDYDSSSDELSVADKISSSLETIKAESVDDLTQVYVTKLEESSDSEDSSSGFGSWCSSDSERSDIK